MTAIPQYMIYFLGPFMLAWLIGRKRLNVGYKPFFVGALFFLLSQIAVGIVAGMGAAIALMTSLPLIATITAAVAAGVCEEGCRYIAFKQMAKRQIETNRRTGVMYAIGHSGLESWMVGGLFLIAVLSLSQFPEMMDAETTAAITEMSSIPMGETIYGAFERLIGGLAIHTAFTLVVVMAILRSDRRYLYLAMLWHAVHDIIFMSPQVSGYLASSMTARVSVILAMLVIYCLAIWKLWAAVKE